MLVRTRFIFWHHIRHYLLPAYAGKVLLCQLSKNQQKSVPDSKLADLKITTLFASFCDTQSWGWVYGEVLGLEGKRLQGRGWISCQSSCYLRCSESGARLLSSCIAKRQWYKLQCREFWWDCGSGEGIYHEGRHQIKGLERLGDLLVCIYSTCSWTRARVTCPKLPCFEWFLPYQIIPWLISLWTECFV